MAPSPDTFIRRPRSSAPPKFCQEAQLAAGPSKRIPPRAKASQLLEPDQFSGVWIVSEAGVKSSVSPAASQEPSSSQDPLELKASTIKGSSLCLVVDAGQGLNTIGQGIGEKVVGQCPLSDSSHPLPATVRQHHAAQLEAAP